MYTLERKLSGIMVFHLENTNFDATKLQKLLKVQ